MNLQWEGSHSSCWFLRDKDIDVATGDENTYVVMDVYRDRFMINWWITLDRDEPKKTCQFEGALEEAKAYAVALVRMGCTE
jgi:hypothetical protein